MLSLWRTWVQFLVGELKSHKPYSAAKKQKESNYRALNGNNKDCRTLKGQAQPNSFSKCGRRMKTFSDMQVPKSWSQQTTGKLLKTVYHHPKKVSTQGVWEARKRAEPQGGSTRAQKTRPPSGLGSLRSTAAPAAELTRLGAKKLS